MKKKDREINEKVFTYLKEKTDENFTELYLEIKLKWRSDRVIENLSHRYALSNHDVISVLDECVLTALESYKTFGDEYSFYNYLSSISSKRVINRAKELTRDKRGGRASPNYEDVQTMEDDPYLVKFVPHANEENEDFDNYVKKSEQRQLLALLLEKADDKSRQAVEAYSISKSYNEAAKLLGISNHAVKRRVQKVAKLFNPSEYGEITDYFTVETCEVS